MKALGGDLEEFPDYQPSVEQPAADVAPSDEAVREGAAALARAMGARGAIAVRHVPAAGSTEGA